MTSAQVLVREHFEFEAGLWKEIYESDTVEAAVYQTRQLRVLQLVDDAGLRPGARVLEIGCGAGWTAAALTARGFRVHAVDLVPAMLRTTREVARNALPAAADAQKLPFADGSFDLVVGIALLEWVAPAALLAEVARVLRAGGRTILTATNRWSLQRCLDPYLNPWFEPVKSALRKRARAHAHSRTHSTAELNRACAEAGMRTVHASTAGYGPFTFFKRKLMPGAKGARLHRNLQERLSRGGYALVMMAEKNAR